MIMSFISGKELVQTAPTQRILQKALGQHGIL